MDEVVSVADDRSCLVDIVADDRLLKRDDVRRQPLVAGAEDLEALLPVSAQTPDVVRGDAQCFSHHGATVTPPHSSGWTSRTVCVSSHR